MISIRFGTADAVRYIADNLRALDRREMEAMSSATDLPGLLTFKVMTFSREVYVASKDKPIAAWGYVELWPHVGGCFAFGTDEWGLAMRAVINHVRRYMFPRVIEAGYHRMECRALADREDVARFVALLGGEPEALLRKAGKGGEDLMIYRWIRRG